MKMKSTCFIILTLLVGNSYRVSAQAEGDYRSIATGLWSATTTWERFTTGAWVAAPSAPTSTDGVIDIQNGHTVTVNAAITADQVIVESGGILTISAASTIADGTGTDLSILSGGTLNIAAALAVSGNIDNSGTIGWSAANITFATGTLNNSGTFNFTGNNTIVQGSGTNALNNLAGGVITKSVGNSVSAIQIAVNNAGTLNVNSGSLVTNQTTSVVTNSGTINLNGTTTFSQVFNGSMIFNPGSVITGTGLFRLEGTVINLPLTTPTGITVEVNQNVTGTGSLTVNGIMNWVANAIRIPTTVATGGTLNFIGVSNKTLNAAFTLNGTTNWIGTGALVFNAATLTNNGTFNENVGAAGDIHAFAGVNSIVNNGTFAKIDAAANTLTVTSVPMTLNSTGILKGNGTINFTGAGGTLTNNGGIIAPGNNVGSLTINPSAVSAGATVEIELLTNAGAGTGNDLLTLTNSTDLTGSILTIIDNPGAPTGTYTIMTTSAGTFTGTFATVNKSVDYASPVISGNTVTIDKITTLPVTWGPFTATASDGKVVLNWTTLQEQNTSHFVVEHSVNGQKFDEIGRVAAAGDASLPTSYTFTDPSPSNGKNYYRLHQVDLDGQAKYSEVRYLSMKGTADTYVNVYPNPLRDVMHVDVAADPVEVMINDMSGRRAKAFVLQPGMHTVSVGDLGRGIYQVVTYVKGKVVASQLMSKL